jgi:hypothetical protein
VRSGEDDSGWYFESYDSSATPPGPEMVARRRGPGSSHFTTSAFQNDSKTVHDESGGITRR